MKQDRALPPEPLYYKRVVKAAMTTGVTKHDLTRLVGRQADVKFTVVQLMRNIAKRRGLKLLRTVEPVEGKAQRPLTVYRLQQ